MKPATQPAACKRTVAKPAKTKARPGPDPRAMQRVASRLKAVCDPIRATILSLTAASPLHVGALVEHTGQTQPNISHHLKLMTLCGVLECRREGKRNFYAPTELGRTLAGLLDALSRP